MKVTGFQPNFIKQEDKSVNLLKQLASGQRVNSAADDAAGLAIINRLSAELDGFLTQSQNGQNGLSLAQTADAAYSEINDSSLRIRELTTQAGNGMLNDSDRRAIQTEITSLTEHINGVASNTSFAGVDLLSNNGSIGLAIGSDPDSNLRIDITTKDAADKFNTLGLNGIDVTTPGGAASGLSVLDNIAEFVNSSRSELGATQNRLASSLRNISNQHEQLSAARSRIADADYAALASQKVSNDILRQGQIAMQGQSHINSQQAVNLLS